MINLLKKKEKRKKIKIEKRNVVDQDHVIERNVHVQRIKKEGNLMLLFMFEICDKYMRAIKTII